MLQSCLTLCNHMDYSTPGSSVHRDSSDKNARLGCHALIQGFFWSRDGTTSLMSSALAGEFFTTSATWEAHKVYRVLLQLRLFFSIFSVSFLNFSFAWRIIALHYCAGFCHTSTWSSHRHTDDPSLLNLPPVRHPIHPSRLPQSTGLSSLSRTANSHWVSVLHTAVYMFPCSSPFIPPSSFFSLCPQVCFLTLQSMQKSSL